MNLVICLCTVLPVSINDIILSRNVLSNPLSNLSDSPSGEGAPCAGGHDRPGEVLPGDGHAV